MLKLCIQVSIISLLSLPNIGEAGSLSRAQHKLVVSQAAACEQVISCGTKDGKRKEYPTPCAARDDGATNISPKTGSSCDSDQ
jgi:hypothetical protein